jgi:hypothetical protein
MILQPKDVMALLALVAVVVLILARTLLTHQRKMTELMQRTKPSPVNTQDSDEMRVDMSELKQLVQQQAITIDNLSGKIDRLTTEENVRQRIGNK